MKVGYIRVSTEEQNTARQEVMMEELGVEKIFMEKITAKTQCGREQLEAMLQFVREGDEVVVESISRIARNTRDLLEIVERLEAKSRSRSYIEKASAELAGIREITLQQAEELVYQYIHEIIDAFQNMDEILAEINRKNTQYQKAAINRAKFYLIGGEDVRGQLKEILSAVNEKINAEGMELGGIYRITFLDELVKIYSAGVLDERSLFVPLEGKKEFKPVALLNELPDEALRQAKLKKMMETMERVLNPQKIDRYVLDCLQGRERMLASELPLATTEDFVYLIYIRLYGQRRTMRYAIEAAEDITVNGYRFRDYVIRRKGMR